MALFPSFGNQIGLRRVRVYENIRVRKISSAPFLPLGLGTVADFLHIDRAEDPQDGQVTEQDSTLTLVISAVTDWWENHMGVCILRSTWEQTQDAIKESIHIRRGPMLGVNSIYTIPGFTGSTGVPVLMDADYWAVAGNEVISDSWPVHRGKASVILNYDAGYVDYLLIEPVDPDALTADEIAEAQLLVPHNIRVSLLNTIGHIWENREGAKAMSKYEVDAKLAGLTPPNTEMLAEGVGNVSLTGKCWK